MKDTIGGCESALRWWTWSFLPPSTSKPEKVPHLHSKHSIQHLLTLPEGMSEAWGQLWPAQQLNSPQPQETCILLEQQA